MMLYKRFGKRLLDITASVLSILVLSPIFLLIGIMVWIKLGRPILFTQVRPGYLAKPFTMLKFRTMKNDKNNEGKLLSDEERITPFGQWLRSTSLDELPELFNVFLGHMSLVGPRPLLMSYIPLYSKEQYRRHEVKPGITGLAQVSGRNSLSWPKRLANDVEYVNRVSFLLDIKILFKTILKVIKREDIVSEGFVSSAPFRGETEDET
jgi:lipopolysaccharide/colanic/teichoic acid biosynthesis glycosyltransferase